MFYFTLDETRLEKTKILGSPIIESRGASTGIRTINDGTASVANGDWTAHGLWKTPQVVLVDPELSTYDGVPVLANCVAMNSTHWQAGLLWTNGTVINDPLDVYWIAKT